MVLEFTGNPLWICVWRKWWKMFLFSFSGHVGPSHFNCSEGVPAPGKDRTHRAHRYHLRTQTRWCTSLPKSSDWRMQTETKWTHRDFLGFDHLLTGCGWTVHLWGIAIWDAIGSHVRKRGREPRGLCEYQFISMPSCTAWGCVFASVASGVVCSVLGRRGWASLSGCLSSQDLPVKWQCRFLSLWRIVLPSTLTWSPSKCNLWCLFSHQHFFRVGRTYLEISALFCNIVPDVQLYWAIKAKISCSCLLSFSLTYKLYYFNFRTFFLSWDGGYYVLLECPNQETRQLLCWVAN